MFEGKRLENFCELALKIGVNLQKGQGLLIVCPVEKREVAHELTKKAYEYGAKIVRVKWQDEILDKLNYMGAEKEALAEVPKWQIAEKNDLVENGFCYIAIDAEDPSAFKDVPAEKLSAVARARSKAFKKYSDAVMSNAIRWCVVSVPTEVWAKQVFPAAKNAEDELTEAIAKTMRLNYENPVEEWEKHVARLDARAQFLNSHDFEYLHFENSLGTDLYVGLAEGHEWLSAKEAAKDGVPFVANMPTEEVFTAPHRLKTEGVVKSALPLSYNGQIVDKFSIKFKKGKVTDFYAEKGYDVLKELIETDEGTRRIGEVALIGKHSPIAEQHTLFFNTLFDENASCHLALGKAYPTTLKGGGDLSVKELKARGANDSVEHVDFMIGTPDLKVTGIKKDGTKVPVFKDGEWCV